MAHQEHMLVDSLCDLLSEHHIAICDIEMEGLFAFLTNDLFLEILNRMDDHKSFARAATVNKRWNQQSGISWKKICEKQGLLKDEPFWYQIQQRFPIGTVNLNWKWVVRTKLRTFKENEIKIGPGTCKEARGTYEGDFLDDKKHGFGTMITDDEVMYKGSWSNNMKVGYGVVTFKGGALYEGEWAADKKNGYGKYVFSNGDIYTGYWKDNRKHGEGSYVFGSGEWEGDRYDGEWADDKKCGYGEYRWKEGDVFKGNWENDNFNGMGTYIYSCGDVYVGEWKEDKKVGHGVYTYAHGGKYDGLFSNGKRHGHGIFVWADGDTFHGEWVNGSRKGRGIVHCKNGRTLEQEWDEPPKANYSKCEPPKFPPSQTTSALTTNGHDHSQQHFSTNASRQSLS